MAEAPPRRTPLYDEHLAAGAKMVEFAGWEMPVQYAGVIEEHRAVRGTAGLFDVSHMGEIRVSGRGAVALLQGLTPNDVFRLAPGRAQYSGLLTDAGTYVDDLLVYRLGAEEFLVVVNAANTAADHAWMQGRASGEAELAEVTDEWALLALQGPRAARILQRLAGTDLSVIRYYRFIEGTLDSASAIISRTGYTGEDGFEIFVRPEDAAALWRRLLEVGAPDGLVPAGLGARDTLRLEAAMALYGHEIDRCTTPFEAGLDWVVKLDKGDFVGRGALAEQRRAGVARKLVGFEVAGRGIARQGHAVVVDGRAVGQVTSGTWSPTFARALGMAYVPAELASPGLRVELDIRGKRVEATLVGLPFYRRPPAA